jgi:hypothetical protein
LLFKLYGFRLHDTRHTSTLEQLYIALFFVMPIDAQDMTPCHAFVPIPALPLPLVFVTHSNKIWAAEASQSCNCFCCLDSVRRFCIVNDIDA